MKISFVRLMFRIFPMQMKSAPFLNSLEITLGMTDAAVSVGGTIAMQILFDTMTQAAGGGVDFWSCAVLLIIASAFVIGELIVNGVFNYLYGVVHGKAGGYVGRLLRSKLIKIDPALFENTEFLDDLNKAKDSFYLIPHFAMTLYHIVGFYGVYFIGIGIYLFHLKPILLLILLLSFIPALLAQMVRAKVFAKLEQSAAPIRREYEYYQKALCDREYYKETRILGAFQYFYGLFTDTMTLLTGKIWKAERKTALLQLLLNSTSFAGMAVACYMLFEATMSGEITIGAFAAIFAALGNIFYKMHMIITWAIGIMNKDIGKVAHFVQILDMPECSGESDTPDFSKGITAKDISFTYPGREQPAIDGVSLHIAHGETIAIVGENGAGKSTLVRLLTGIFRPDAGNVAIGGVDTAKTAPASIYNGLSGVFQKYQKYKMTLRENVAISDIGASPTDTKIKTALREADVNLGHEVHYETMLSPEFNGIDLSGGQWQRLAIARGLYRINGFIVLDEPTSAIDPIEETKIFMQFQKLAEGKCAVVVTHRLGSAKLAHRIVVMDGGRIVDMGTHEELLSRSGKYSDMWAAQAQWYRHTIMPDTTPLPVARGAVTTDFV